MRFPCYQHYKPSELEWFGRIPQNWAIKRVQDISCKVGDGLHGTPKYIDLSSYYFINGNNLIDGNICIFPDTKCVNEEEFKEYRKAISYNAVLLSINGTIGNLALYKGESIVLGKSVAYINLRRYIHRKYIYYFFQSVSISNFFETTFAGTTIKNLSLKTIRTTAVLVPSCSEQEKIFTYLDTKTALIDRKIDLLTQKAQHYEELKKSLINETVTRGLDKSVPMKDSGIEWIGKIPQHWEIKRHKDSFRLITKKSENENLIKIGLENIESKTGRFIETESEFDGDGMEFKPNDILFGKLRPYLAKVYLSNFVGSAVGDIFVYRPKLNIDPNFSLYMMLSHKYIDVINSSTVGAKMPRVSSNFIANLPVVTPSLSEQKAISTYLDTKTAQIDQIIQTINTQIEKLKELRKTLINDVVTGKIKVTDNEY